MLLKITIVLFILSIVLTFILKALITTMDTEETIVAHFANNYPVRVYIVALVWLLFWIASIIMIILTVLTWG